VKAHLPVTPIGLARIVLPSYKWAQYHLLIQRYLMLLVTGQLKHPDGRPCKRLMVSLPPQHAKSTLTSQLLPAIVLSQNPCAKLILLSYAAGLATSHSVIARSHFTEVFGGLLGGSQAQNDWHTADGGYLLSAGMQGGVTGRAATGCIIDDVHSNIEDSSSPTQRQKAWDTYSSVAETRLSPAGWVLVVGTRWNPDDLQGRLLETEAEKWIVLSFPALAETDDVLGRSFGEALWTERYGQAWYEEKRQSFELRGQGYLFNALYQCNPTGNSALCAFSDPSYFGPHLWSEGVEPKQTVLRVLALDPSKSKTGKGTDFNAFADVCLDVNNHLHCRMHLDRQPLTATYDQALNIIRDAEQAGNPFKALMVECNMFQEAVYLHLKELLASRFPYILCVPHQTASNQSKFSRIKIGLEPLLAQKRLHFVNQTVSNRITVQQLKEFPNAANDDGPDAIEMGTQLLNLLMYGAKNPPQPKLILRA
jgi:hypothetical protein